MKELSFEQMERIEGGDETLGTLAGASCGAAFSGFIFGGFPGVITLAIFGPSCIGLSIGYVYNNN